MDRRAERGLALIAVLWAAVLLAVLALQLNAGVRSNARLAANLIEAAKAEALADAGVYRALLAVLDSEPVPAFGEELAATLGDRPNLRRVLLDRPEIVESVLLRRLRAAALDDSWRRDGTVYAWAQGDGMVRIAIQDEAGKVDLNVGSEELILALLRSAGLDDGPAAAALSALATMAGVDGQDGYRRVADLRRTGLSEHLYERLAPLITVHSGLMGIDPLVAPVEVLAALPGIDDATLSILLQARTDPRIEELAGVIDIAHHFAVAEREILTIRAEALTDGAAFMREAVVEVLRDQEPRVVLLDWRQGTP